MDTKGLASIIAILTLLFSLNAKADLIQVTWEGAVVSSSNAPGGITNGDVASGTFTYDTEAEGRPSQGGYFVYDTDLFVEYTIGGISGTISDLDISLLPDPLCCNLQIRNDGDFVTRPTFGGDLNDLNGGISIWQFILTDPTGNALPPSGLPDSMSFSDGWGSGGNNSLVISWIDGGQLSANFTSLTSRNLSIPTTSVPEPGTLALLGIGLFGMGLARRRKASTHLTETPP